jgi:hypothetical protein
VTARRIVVIALFALAACRGEQPAPPQSTTTSALSTAPAPAPAPAPNAATQSAAAPPPAPVKVSTPSKCGGDGSYAKAVDCFRIAADLHFAYDEPLLHADGELTRLRPGVERVRFKTSGSEWVGEAKPSGLVWTRDGKHDEKPPTFTDRIYQRVAMYVDPQKKEREAKFTGTDLLNGEPYAIYEFTNGATGAASVVWVSKRDGSILRIRTTPLPQLADVSPEYTLTIAR